MKCDHCEKSAVVHEVTMKDGVKKEIHLCEEHAQNMGIAIPGHQPIDQLLTKFVVSQSNEKSTRKARQKLTCKTCGLTFSQFRKAGVLGCPTCYESFEKKLTPLVERAQNGGAHHVGKAPQRAGGSIDRQAQIQRLLHELDSAISAEQYERAAELRDELRTIELHKADGDEPTTKTKSPTPPASAAE